MWKLVDICITCTALHTTFLVCCVHRAFFFFSSSHLTRIQLIVWLELFLSVLIRYTVCTVLFFFACRTTRCIFFFCWIDRIRRFASISCVFAYKIVLSHSHPGSWTIFTRRRPSAQPSCRYRKTYKIVIFTTIPHAERYALTHIRTQHIRCALI